MTRSASSSQIKISVLIPTRERAEYLHSAIASCLAQDYENCQFIVSDNLSNDSTKAVVHSFNDRRLKYVNPGRRLSMSSNFEFAISLISDGYVVSIGDDDALMPDALPYLRSVISETNAEAIAGRWNCYFWDTYPVISARDHLLLWISHGYEFRDSRAEVRRALNFNYSYCHKLAGLYYGCISFDLLDKLKIGGSFFQSITPDAYSAFACSLAARKFVYSSKAFVLAGLSGKSNGVSQLLNANSSEASKFVAENTHAFQKELVYCPSEPVILAEAFLKLQHVHPELIGKLELNVRRMLVAASRQASPNVRSAVDSAILQMTERYGLNAGLIRVLASFPDFASRLRVEWDEFLHPHVMHSCDRRKVTNSADAAKHAATVIEQGSKNPSKAWLDQQKFRLSRRLSR